MKISNNIIFFFNITLILLAFNACQFEHARSPFNTSEYSQALFFSGNETNSSDTLSGNLQIGMAARTINPTNLTSLTGFGAPMRRLLPPDYTNIGKGASFCKPYKSIDMQPRVKAMLISGQNSALQTGYFLILNFDLIAIPTDFTIKIMALLNSTYPNLNLNHSNVQLIATHTHSGSAGLTENPFWAVAICDRFNPDLYNIVSATTMQVVGEAFANLTLPNTIDYINGTVEGYNYSRFDSMVVDQNMYFMNFKDASSQSLGCFLSYSVHPTWYGINDLVFSSDIAGYIENELQKQTNAQTCLFFNATVGNASAAFNNALKINTYASNFIQNVFTQASISTPMPDQFQYGSLFITLPNFTFNYTGCGININFIPRSIIDSVISFQKNSITNNITKIAWFSFNGTYFFLIPGEPLYDFKMEFQSQVVSQFPNIKSYFFISTSNDYIGYIMTPNSYNKKSIEACSTMHGSETSSVIINGFINALNSAKQ